MSKLFCSKKDLSEAECANKMNGSVTFLAEKRDDVVKKFIDTGIKMCEDLEIPVRERRVRGKKNGW